MRSELSRFSSVTDSECQTGRPLIVQGDHTVLLEADNPSYEEARDCLARFAELVKSPEHVHTYRITPLSVWNAAATGLRAEEVVDSLVRYSKYPVPDHISVEIREYFSRYGRLRLEKGTDSLVLNTDDRPLAELLLRKKEIGKYLRRRISDTRFEVSPFDRGMLKQELIRLGYPAEDLAGYSRGEHLDIAIRDVTVGGSPFLVREYQRHAVEAFHAGGSDRGGSGVIVLPCGAGKTVVGMDAMSRVSSSTLILTTGITACRQWKGELLDKTSLTDDQIGEYTGERKEIRPVTITTYQILTHRKSAGDDDFPHFRIFNEKNWGLIIYDEVHLLPAPVFQITAEIQATRRLGLTATLVREDNKEEDVFALIGPKKYDVPWKALEKQGWIAKARCEEIRVPLPERLRMDYSTCEPRQRFRFASCNPAKLEVIDRILSAHPDEQKLVIGMYLDQLREIAARLDAPVLTGQTSNRKREKLYGDFRSGKVNVLVVSKVANFAIDLPEASVAIQVSGTFGSRQEEAQRLGRVLRPKKDGRQARFYSIVTRDTEEQEFAHNRQLFLTEQGYNYSISYAEGS